MTFVRQLVIIFLLLMTYIYIYFFYGRPCPHLTDTPTMVQLIAVLWGDCGQIQKVTEVRRSVSEVKDSLQPDRMCLTKEA